MWANAERLHKRAMTTAPTLGDAEAALRRVFGHQHFRSLQAEVIGEVLAGRNVLAVLPTGGGKSLCYQIPSLLLEGLGVVVSPLIALMADQVAALQQQGVAAARLDSDTSPDERRAIWALIEENRLDLLYVSPEGLMQAGLLERLARRPVALLAIDEAHCVSQWGHDFRPDYRLLGRLAEVFPGAPRLAVTATADARTREDIRSELRLGDARDFVDSFARPELQLSAERKDGPVHARVLSFVHARRGLSGVVYSGSRAGAEDLAERLTAAGHPAAAYHAGLDKSLRRERLATFMAQDDAIMVATIAFGMGIDKPNVRYVVHADPPASIEAYWQEVGRAGRDGRAAEGFTLYGASDLAWALRRLDGREISDTVKQVQARKVRQLYAMLEGASCRSAAVRRYFGETQVEVCGRCDLCVEPPSLEDVSERARMALSAVHRLKGRYGRGRLVDHLLGKTKAAFPGETELSTFGVGKGVGAADWRRLIDHLLFEGLLEEDANDGRPLIALGDQNRVREIYQGREAVGMRRPAATRAPPPRTSPVPEAPTGEGARLFEALRAWRKAQAALQRLPPYVIFHDKTLWEIALQRPKTLAALGSLSGVGQGKTDRYGDAVLKIVHALMSQD